MSLTKFTGAVNIISSLADKPAKTAQQLKGDFDTVGALLKEYINDHLTEELDSKISEFATKIQNNTSSLDNMLNRVYPVGSIYMSVDNTNPTTLFGGTWIAWGSGRVPVGINSNETEFNSVEKTGGAKTHTLTTEQLPTHAHTIGNHTHNIPSLSGSTDYKNLKGNVWNMAVQSQSTGLSANGICTTIGGGTGNAGYATNSQGVALNWTDTFEIDAGHNHSITTNSSTTGQSGSGNTGNTGSGQAHNNLQPYITCYMWKRTA